MDFFDFLWVICHLSINTRIDVHLLLFALGNERTPVACKSLRSDSQFTRFTRDRGVPEFPNSNKIYFNR